LLVGDRLVMQCSSFIFVCPDTETGEWKWSQGTTGSQWLQYKNIADNMVPSNEREILFLEKNSGELTDLCQVKSLNVRDGTVRTNFTFNISEQGFRDMKSKFHLLICENQWLLILVIQHDGTFAGFNAGIYVCELLDEHQYRLISFLRLRSGVFNWTSMYQPPGCSKTICVHDSQSRVVSFLELNESGHLSERSYFSDDNDGCVVISRSRVLTRDRANHYCVYNVETGEREFAFEGNPLSGPAMVSLTRNELIFPAFGGFGVTAYCLDESRILAPEEQPAAADGSSQA